MRLAGPGRPEPLGVTLLPGGANVAWPSAHAERLELCLFDEAGEREAERIALPARTGDVHHGFVEGLAPGARYGLRAHGPWAPREGHRFNPAKLLVDPWATALDRPFAWHECLRGDTADGSHPDERDSAAFVPKAVLVAASPAPGARVRVAPGDRIVYELHVRGFTKTHPAIPDPLRGTFAGLAHPAAVGHLKRLGITTVELMPVAAAIDERHLPPLGLSNYWGYNPVALLAPDPHLAPGGLAEVAACVRALHEAEIEVLLDVVLNHTGEGDERGPTVSLRGLDNATFHRLRADDPSRYADDAGCGNTLALERAQPLRLALDALRHWALAAGVDGFRYDLATTLARGPAGFDANAPFLAAARQDPVLRDLVHVAEPWDLGAGGHRLGAFPAGWGEWNDRYRDTVRRFWRGDVGLAGEFATRLAGSADVFGPAHRLPSDSLDFVTAHDGFTLADLVSHERKHNEANGEANRDGTDANHAWNHGTEGASEDEAIVAARRADARALLATLLVSRGTPMISHGDELGRTQQGNNNAYAQDNALAWIDWAKADETLVAFTSRLCALRREHPALREDRWLTGEPPDAGTIPDVEWRRPDGAPLAAGDWTGPATRALVVALHAAGENGTEGDRVVLAFNTAFEPVAVAWPPGRDGTRWRIAVDSSRPDAADGEPPAALPPRSVIVLVEAASPGRRHAIEPGTLARLAQAAGIAPRWHDVDGGEHEVTIDTKRALLEAMHLGAGSESEARARLRQIAEEGVARRVPATFVVREGKPARLPIASRPGRGSRGHLVVTTAGGTRHAFAFAFESSERDRMSAPDGRGIDRVLVPLPPLPAGVHAFALEDEPDASGTLLVAPAACHRPAALEGGERAWGLAAHLYALRGESGQGVGDFTTLVEASLATARAGGLVVGLNPLHALHPGDRDRASPYHPSDRRFLDPVYLDVMRLPGLAEAPEAREALMRLAPRFGELESRASVDWAGVWEAKRAVLEAAFTAFERRGPEDALRQRFERFVAEGGEALRRFAIFEAIAAAHPSQPWTAWPEALRSPEGEHVGAFAESNAMRVRYAMYLQWLCDRQLGDAARAARAGGLAIGFYRDLAVGCAPDGAEAWSQPGLFARGVSIGAPPDPFCRDGQVWNLPPPIPRAFEREGFAPFRALMAANMRHAGALRIDHAMGLERLFWVPEGACGLDGAYVAQPKQGLLAALALESLRAGCLVVGEDLGTVPPGFRETMAAERILSTRVLGFERDGERFRPPGRWPADAVACVATHDLPPLAGWWAGTDLEERESLGLATAAESLADWQAREAGKRALCEAVGEAGLAPPDPASPQPPLEAVHAFLAKTPCALRLLQADDLAGERVALNLPGTDRERDNWRRRIRVKAADLLPPDGGSR